jgi:alkanesulfonate monooxygenase SsuD/methylene tetrahydromethanopterin reductase-like flavin-dependent oxidoreductase (luciferase family)
MRLGFGLLTCQRFPGDTRTNEDFYADALDLAVYAEELGFDSVWTSEHHFVDDGYTPSILPLCAAIAARTSRIEIGTGLLLIPLHDPIRVAEDATVIDLISRGRLIVGLGLGWRAEEFDGFGVPLRERARRLERAVEVLRGAWGGRPVAHGGTEVIVTPRPGRAGGPPIWIGASVERAVRRAGRIADGFVADGDSPETFGDQVGWAMEERGDRPFSVGLHMSTFVSNHPDAWDVVAPYAHYVSWKYDDMEHARLRSGPSPSPPPITPDDDRALRDAVVYGTPREVADRIRAFEETAGTELHFIADLHWPGMDPALQRETMRIFAQEVAPLLR